MSKYLHFSIGPVQGFVAQSRRTRDLWAGSYVLSWLIAHAMRAAKDEGGKIVSPHVEGKTLNAFAGEVPPEARPTFGQLPNHFTVDLGGVTDDGAREVARKAEEAVRDAWKRLADGVYSYIEPAIKADGRSAEIKALWDQQIKDFGETHWAISESPSFAVLHQRKAWRVPSLNDECGDPCSVMGGYQEISTYDRASGGRKAFDDQKKFWTRIRREAGKDHKQGVSPFDLPEFERLCAVALVKRLFPMLAKDDESLLGYKLDVKHWPSTAHLAGYEFKKVLQNKSLDDELSSYPKDVFDAAKKMPGNTLRGAFLGVGESAASSTGELYTFENLGGEYLFESALLQSWTRNAFSKPNAGIDGPVIANELAKKLRTLYTKAEGRPSPFYAVLLMDGDRLGNLFHGKNPDEAQKLSEQLADFCKGVPGIIEARAGYTIYTGGDDVLALLPVSTAVDAARELKTLYCEALPPGNPESIPTISAGIVFARFNVPLMDVIAEAHHTLDDIAKEEAGRAACAVTVLKGGSDNVRWRGKWKQVDDILGARQALDDEQLSRSFTHRILGIFQKLVRDPKLKHDKVKLPKSIGMEEIIKSEYERSVERRGNDLSKEEIKTAAKKFLDAMRWVEVEKSQPPESFQPSGMLLARFLQQHGGLIND
ncbi:hypothetical protein JCM16814_04630 [Desulfobaculum senezii]